MGMFDRFFFEDGVLPDNKVPAGYEFQTKSLENGLFSYKVASDGTVNLFDMDGAHVVTTINDAATVYSHEFLYSEPDSFRERKYLGSRYQEFKVVIVNSKVVHVEKLSEDGYEVPKNE